MTAIALIAGNFLREQRWYMVLLLVWAFATEGMVSATGTLHRDDLVFFIRQQAVYGLAVTASMIVAAIQNERRSRHILAVLSKAVERREYLAGLLCGALVFSVVYFLAAGLGTQWMAARLQLSGAQVWGFTLPLIAAAALLAAYALFFSTFLHPLLATGATALALGAQYAVERTMPAGVATSLPVFGLIHSLMAFSFQRDWSAPVATSAVAIVEAAGLWLLAAAVFKGRDIAVAVE